MRRWRSSKAWALAAAAAAMAAGCGGDGGPASPSAPAGPATLTVEGLDTDAPFLVPGESVQLRAIRTTTNGGRDDCTDRASWGLTTPSSSPLVIEGPGRIRARWTGQAFLVVACDDASGGQSVTVNGYRIVGTVRHAVTGAPIPGAQVTITQGGWTYAGPDGRFVLPDVKSPTPQLGVLAPGFEPQSTSYTWARQAQVTIDLDATPVQGLLLVAQTRLCPLQRPTCPIGSVREDVRHFDLSQGGLLRVDVFSPLDWPDRLTIQLLCGEDVVRETTFNGGNHVPLFEEPAGPGCDYAIKSFAPSGGFSEVSHAVAVSAH